MLNAPHLWDPTHLSFMVDLGMAFLLGLIHGVTPDEHTWPITFSYAVGGYSMRGGLRAGFIFSLAFAIQCALASELAFLGLAHWQNYAHFEYAIDAVVGIAMATAGWFVRGRALPFFSASRRHDKAALRDPKPWMPAVHGFVAGWGVGPFTMILYTVLAPAMPSAVVGWMPGLVFGLGTLVVQACAGAAIGAWLSRRRLPPDGIRQIGLTTAANTLLWGGCAFLLYGICGAVLPHAGALAVTTSVDIPNLHILSVPFLLLIATVMGIGITSLIAATRSWMRDCAVATTASVD